MWRVEYFFIQAAGLVSHWRAACIFLWLDNIQHFVLMIYNSFGIDDMQGYALIYLCIRHFSVLLFNTSYLKIMYLYLLNVKSRILFYPSRRLGISSTYKVRRISSRAAFKPPLYLITRQRVSTCGLMIYNTSCWWYTATSCGWYTRLRLDLFVYTTLLCPFI